jgi:GTPase
MNAPLVAIIGRPNVGKSTLFNRILGRRQAVTADLPGTTRDRTYALADWNGRSFYIADTGGYIPDAKGDLDPQVRAQAEAAMAEADVIILVTDSQVGLQDVDVRLAASLRKHGRPVLHAVNKVDHEAAELEASSHARLGLGEIAYVSAESGRGMGDLLDRIVASLPASDAYEGEDSVRVSVLGRPNVGKSSIVNAILGTERTVVSPVPGTTRDSVDTELDYQGHRITLVDTAGLRRRSRVDEDLEYFTTLRTIQALSRSQVAILVIEAPENMTSQDQHIASQIIEAGKGMVLAVNKWDLLVEEDHRKADRFKKELAYRAPFLGFVPFVFVSALSGRHVTRLLDSALKVHREMSKRVSTSDLNDFLAEVIEKQPPPAVQGKPVRIYYITQPQAGPAKFVMFCSHPELVPDSYRRFVQNQIRERWSFEGVPVVVTTRPRG